MRRNNTSSVDETPSTTSPSLRFGLIDRRTQIATVLNRLPGAAPPSQTRSQTRAGTLQQAQQRWLTLPRYPVAPVPRSSPRLIQCSVIRAFGVTGGQGAEERGAAPTVN